MVINNHELEEQLKVVKSEANEKMGLVAEGLLKSKVNHGTLEFDNIDHCIAHNICNKTKKKWVTSVRKARIPSVAVKMPSK